MVELEIKNINDSNFTRPIFNFDCNSRKPETKSWTFKKRFEVISGFGLVKQKQFTKISEGNKEKGPEQAKLFFGSTNHFMKNVKSFKFLQTNLVKFCKFNSLSFFV